MVIKFAAVSNLAKFGTRLRCRQFLVKKFGMVCVTFQLQLFVSFSDDNAPSEIF
jgi:hypothetical protein